MPTDRITTAAQLAEVIANARARQDAILKSKGDDYTRQAQDRLANFKRVAAGLKLPPLTVWAVYFHKHVDAIMTFVQTNGQSESEPIAGRFDDAMNYLYLGEALVRENEVQPKPTVVETPVVAAGGPPRATYVVPAASRCGEMSPGLTYHACSLQKGHYGDHEAHDAHDILSDRFSTWGVR